MTATTTTTTAMADRTRWRDLASPAMAAFISVLVNYGGTFVLVFQAAQLAQLSAAQTASWVWSLSIGVGVTGIWLSYRYRAPIITAWSTPGVAFLATVMPHTPYAEVIGAYIISAIAFIVLGMSGAFERLVRLIPGGIAAGLLAGILLQFGVNAFGGASAVMKERGKTMNRLARVTPKMPTRMYSTPHARPAT